MSEEISILPLGEMAMRLKYDPFAKKHCVEIRHACCRGFYRFINVYAEDIPSDGSGLLFSDIAKLAMKKEEEYSRLRKAQSVSSSESP